MIKKALTEVLSEMSWWDWTKTGVVMVAQFTAWFATDGLAFIAESVIATQLAEDCPEAIAACK